MSRMEAKSLLLREMFVLDRFSVAELCRRRAVQSPGAHGSNLVHKSSTRFTKAPVFLRLEEFLKLPGPAGHFISKNSRPQRGQETCPGSHSYGWEKGGLDREWGTFHSKSSLPQGYFLAGI